MGIDVAVGATVCPSWLLAFAINQGSRARDDGEFDVLPGTEDPVRSGALPEAIRAKVPISVMQQDRSTPGRPLRLVYLVTEDWYFCSHRLPMARAARDSGFEVHVATRVADHGPAIEAEGFHLHPLSWTRRDGGWASLRTLRDIISLYRRVRPALVHHVSLRPVVFGAAAARWAGVPAQVNALTGLGFVFTARSAHARLLRTGLRPLLRFLIDHPRSCVVLQNSDDLAYLVDNGIVARTRARLVRGSGVEIGHFQRLPEPDQEPITCAAVTRMLTIKGIQIAVEAIRLLRQRGIDMRLILAGTPDPLSPASLKPWQLTRWAREPGIVWLGHVDDVREVWSKAHIAVLPSLGGEGIPKSLLEAAACGRPIVASDVPGCREIVRPGINGELVAPGDAEALAQALASLARDPERRRGYAAAGRRLVESDLSAEDVGHRIVAVYREMASRPSASVTAVRHVR